MTDANSSSWFEKRLSTGNLLTIGVMIAGLIAGWYQFENRLALQAVKLDQEVVERLRLETRLVKMENERDDTRDRLTRIEVTMKQLGDTSDRILRAVEKGPQER